MLEEAIKEALVAAKLQPVPELVAKIVQLQDTLGVRHGAMLVGPTGGGKTTCYQILATALGELKAKGATVHFRVDKMIHGFSGSHVFACASLTIKSQVSFNG